MATLGRPGSSSERERTIADEKSVLAMQPMPDYTCMYSTWYTAYGRSRR